MKNIKVTVEYETPTTSKFDALMAEYVIAKKLADETVAYYKPLADVAEEAKVDAILEQLETIKEYARRISEITNDAVFIQHWICDRRFDIVYRPNETIHKYEVKWGGEPFTKEQSKIRRNAFFDGSNIIGRWEEVRAYENLEKEAFRLLEDAINKQKNRAHYQQNRLNNIIQGGI